MKLLKLIILTLTVLTFVSCSHHHNKEEHHHHAFNKLCAYEVSLNHFDVAGNENYKIEHEGETYFFSSEEKMNKFKKDLQSNVRSARDNYTSRERK